MEVVARWWTQEVVNIVHIQLRYPFDFQQLFTLLQDNFCLDIRVFFIPRDAPLHLSNREEIVDNKTLADYLSLGSASTRPLLYVCDDDDAVYPQ